MRRALFLALACWLASAHAGVEVRDDRGVGVSLDAPAMRIVSLAPHVTELIYAAGAGAKLVGAVAYSDYPPQARELPLMGDAARIDVERVLAARPDLVVGWSSGNPPGDIARLEALGLKLYLTEPRHLEDIPRHISQLGRLAGTSTVAERAAREFNAELADLRRRYAGRRPVRVFYQIWPQPPTTIGGSHILDEVLRLCGGRNVFAALKPIAPIVSVESVLAAQPEAVIAGAEPEAGDVLAPWLRWPQFDAVRRHHLYALSADYLHRSTPRILEGARQVCARLDEVRGH